MDTTAKHRLEDVFARAAELPTENRAAWLETECAGQPELRAEVEGLLRWHKAPGFMPRPAMAEGTDLGEQLARMKPEEEGDRIGNYKLLEQIGEGGFGVVWVAEQERPVQRRVALKIIKMGMDTKEVIARFEQERQALAMMDHPNIAKVHDAGATQYGRPYFVMELVRGVKITEYCDEANLTTADRLELFIAVCNAVQHAHQKGIIHRDLKPSNILVTLHDGVPVPKVIDFGVAKATQSQRFTDLTVYTQFEQMIGTPLYMSPEQAEMSGLDIDTRSDIYSLGVLLYELLAGRTPFDPAQLLKQGLDEIRRTIREQEPPKPSTAVQTMAAELQTKVARHRQADPARITKLLRGDLDWIVMKALDKDRTRRYDTANGLAADIQRHLNCEPVTAGPPSKKYRIAKFARRNKSLLGVASFVAAVMLAATAISTHQAMLARGANKLASDRLADSEKARREAEAIAEFMVSIFRSADPTRDGRTITVAEKLKDAAVNLELNLLDQPERRIHLQAAIADTFAALGLPMDAIPLQEKVWSYRCKMLGKAHPDALGEMMTLASVYHEASRRKEAIRLQEEALEMSRSALGPEHEGTLSAMNNLANFYFHDKRSKEALAIREELLPLEKKVHGLEHRSTLGSMTNLAISYSDVGRADDAIQLLEEVLPIKRRVLAHNDPYILIAMEALASTYTDASRPKDALKIREALLATKKRVYGPEHRMTLGATTNLAMSYAGVGRLPEAIKLLEEVLPIKRRVLPPNDQYTGAAMKNLARLYNSADRKNEALALREEALVFTREASGPEHSETLIAMHELAHSYRDTDRREDAIQLMEKEVALSRKVRSPEHFETLKSSMCLARLYRSANRHLEALMLSEEVLALRVKTRGRSHRETLEAVDELSDLLLATGGTQRALELLTEYSVLTPDASFMVQKAITLQAWFGKDAEFAATTRRVLELAANTGKLSVADRAAKSYCLRPSTDPQLMRDALALAQRAVKLGENHEFLPYCQLALGMAEYRSGNLDIADVLLETASRTAGDFATVPVTAAYFRAMIRFQTGRETEARQLFTKTEADMKPWPEDEKNPMAKADANDLIVWIANKEAKALLQMPDSRRGTK